MSEHPFVVLVCVSDELASATVAPERQAAILESFRTHGAAIIVGAVERGHCDVLRAAMDVDLDDTAGAHRGSTVTSRLRAPHQLLVSALVRCWPRQYCVPSL